MHVRRVSRLRALRRGGSEVNYYYAIFSQAETCGGDDGGVVTVVV